MADIQELRDKYSQIPGERFFQELFEKDEYKPVLDRKLDTVIDVGALAGEFGAYIYDKAGIIYSIEPYSKYFTELDENIKEFHLTKMIPVNIAIAGHDGETTITSDVQRGANRITSEQGEIVPCMTLASFMNKYSIDHVDVLKIDIECGENEVFLCDSFLTVIHKIDYIIGEHITDDIENVFINNGFRKLENSERNAIYERV